MTRQRSLFYLAFALVFTVGTAGFLYEGCQQGQAGFWGVLDALYRAAQLFLVGFDRSCAAGVDFRVEWLLNIARFGALLLFSYAAVSFILPGLVRKITIAWQCRAPGRRVVVLGYGPLGQSVVAGLRSAQKGLTLTAIHRGITRDLSERSRSEGVVLIEGDPSQPEILRLARADESKAIVVAVGDDMMTIDAAVSVKATTARTATPIRAIVADPELTALLPEAAPRGFLGANGVSYFSLPVEAARLLWAEARFDRTALEMRQPRVHIVIVGCGAQGEAIALETLLSSWRVGLGPPVLSIFDLDENAVRQRLANKAPALFPEFHGTDATPLPPAARAELHFQRLDIRLTDFSRSGTIAKALEPRSDPTAWIFAAPDDALNLKASAQLYSQMLRREMPSAPIRVCVRNGYQDSPLVLADHPVAVARAFGSREETLAASDICLTDPDREPRRLHETYLKQSDAITGKGLPTTAHPAWQELPETLRAANRRLYRQAAMKIEDLGLQWRTRRRAIPTVDASLRNAYIEIEDALDYGRMDLDRPLPREWWHTPLANSTDAQLEHRRANKIRSIAIVEHNRWIMDRALDGWRLTPTPDAALRDDVRRRHHSMHDWTALKPHIRRYDAVLLRALISGEDEERQATAWEKRPMTAMVVPGPSGGTARIHRVTTVEPHNLATELRVIVPPRLDQPTAEQMIAQATDLARELHTPARDDRLCRIRFDFHEPPSAPAIALANALARALLAQRAAAGSPIAEVSGLWRWGRTDPPAIAFIGAHDLDRFKDDAGLAPFLQNFFARRLVTGRVGALITNSVSDPANIAVAAWKSLGAPAPLQTRDLIEAANILVVLSEEKNTSHGIVDEARKRGKRIVTISRSNGQWHSDGPDEIEIDRELGMT